MCECECVLLVGLLDELLQSLIVVDVMFVVFLPFLCDCRFIVCFIKVLTVVQRRNKLITSKETSIHLLCGWLLVMCHMGHLDI